MPLPLGRLALIPLALLTACPAATVRPATEVEVSGAPIVSARPGPNPMASLPAGREIPFSRSTAADLRGYLQAIHRPLEAEWTRGVLAMAGAMLPPEHPANRRDRMAEIEVALDWHDQPAGLRVSRSSGYPPYDASALRAMQTITRLPPLPRSVGERHATLRWRFHRDERACSPALARLEVRPLTHVEALSRAIARGRLERAAQILRAAGGRPELLAIVAGAGLLASDPSLRRLALAAATSSQLAALLGSERDDGVWRAAIVELETRKEPARIVEALTPELAAPRAITALEALARLDARVPDALLGRLLARLEAAVVVAAARLAARPALLEPAVRRWRGTASVAGQLAVLTRRLGPDPRAEKRARALLAGPAAVAVIEAIERTGVSAFDEDLQEVAKNKRAPEATRALAIKLCGKRRLSLVALYLGLQEEDHPEVQIASARALAATRGNKLALSYRLAGLAMKARGRVAAEAIAALSRVGDERFRFDAVRLGRLLDERGRALVIGALWGFGDPAVPELVKRLSDPSAAIRAAAEASLRRIPSAAARKALAATPRTEAKRKVGPLEGLLRLAAELAGRAGRTPDIQASNR
jgi:TonB family protein